jgi:hypothetical protein
MWLLSFLADRERSSEQVLLSAQPRSDLLLFGLFIEHVCNKKSGLYAPNHKINFITLMEVIISGKLFTLR